MFYNIGDNFGYTEVYGVKNGAPQLFRRSRSWCAGGNPQALPGANGAAWTVQEEGSQVVALAVGAREGERVLDACAGRGNKAAILARAVGAIGRGRCRGRAPAKLARFARSLPA